MFEATHGTAPKHAGLDKANPGSLLFSGVMMFEYIGWQRSRRPRCSPPTRRPWPNKVVTYDFARQMDGATEVKTSAFADAVIKNM